MPKLWEDTIESHRRAVRDRAIDATVTLVSGHGLRSVTMSQIAQETGIGRATLYKYFPDVDSILRTWHEREIARHLAQIADARDQAKDAAQRLRAVLKAYATVAYEARGHHDSDLAALLHRDERVIDAQRQVEALIGDVLAEASRAGEIRDDMAVDELAAYCLHALAAARGLSTMAAVDRLVDVTLAGLHPQTDGAQLPVA